MCLCSVALERADKQEDTHTHRKEVNAKALKLIVFLLITAFLEMTFE